MQKYQNIAELPLPEHLQKLPAWLQGAEQGSIDIFMRNCRLQHHFSKRIVAIVQEGEAEFVVADCALEDGIDYIHEQIQQEFTPAKLAAIRIEAIN